MRVLYRLIAWITGKNPKSMPLDVIVDQMNESRPLPMGRKEFDEWSNRIISGALVEAEHSSQMFALANMLLHLGPTESHKPDAFFIHSLRKFAVNQVADAVRKELHEAAKARTAETETQKETEASGEATLARIRREAKDLAVSNPQAGATAN